MPPLVNQYIGTLVPAQTPFFVRPIVNMVFDKLNEMIYKPAIQAQVAIVRPSSLFSIFSAFHANMAHCARRLTST